MKILAFLFPASFSFEAQALAAPRAAPPWRVVLLLAAVVLLAHALVLGASPSRFGLALEPAAKQAPAMLTRRIDPPPVQAAAAQPTPPQPSPQPRPQAAPQKKAAPAPTLPEPSATPEPAPSLEMDVEAPVAALAPSSVDLFGPGLPVLSPPQAAPPPAADPTAAAATPAASAAAPGGPSQTPVTAIALPASVALHYHTSASTKGLSYQAKAELIWHNSGTRYDARMTVSKLFVDLRSMTSQGQVSAQGLAPSRFSDKSRAEVAAHFEPDKGQVSFSANTPSLPWVQGAQDRVSVFLQLGGMLAGNPAAFPAGASISIYTVGPRDAETWTFEVEGEETLRLPFGELATLRLSRQLRHEHDQKLEVWYAPALGYLPVRNKLTQANGDFADQQLSAVNRP